MDESPTREGKAEFTIASINGHSSYKVFGPETFNSTTPTPLIILHGGPGSGHEYCLPFRKLWPLYGIPVIFYDQIGCGASTRLRDKVDDEAFWSIDLFVDQLESLLAHFDLNTRDRGYHLLGHSFGGIVSMHFAARQPPGLKRLILSGAPGSSQHFLDGLQLLKKQLSPASQQAIEEAIEKGDFTSPGYTAGMTEFFKMFLCRADPWPPELLIDFQHQAEDTTSRMAFFGSTTPWVCKGFWRKTDTLSILPQIIAPTMLITGEFDTCQHIPSEPLFAKIPKVRWVQISNASHMPFLDSEEICAETMKYVGQFLEPEPVE